MEEQGIFAGVKRLRHAMTFDLLVEEADAPPQCASEQFVCSGLRAARVAHATNRRTILGDLSDVLGCSPDELGFLFTDPVIAANDSDPVIMPDYRRWLHEDMRVAAL